MEYGLTFIDNDCVQNKLKSIAMATTMKTAIKLTKLEIRFQPLLLGNCVFSAAVVATIADTHCCVCYYYCCDSMILVLKFHFQAVALLLCSLVINIGIQKMCSIILTL